MTPNNDAYASKIPYSEKHVQTRLMKGMLDLIVMNFLNDQPTHGYELITKIRKAFGQYFGPSTIYPVLYNMEKHGYAESEWSITNDKPKKVYKLTLKGQNLLNSAGNSLNLICNKIGNQGIIYKPSDGIMVSADTGAAEQQVTSRPKNT